MVLVVLGHCGKSIFFNGVYYIHLPVFIMVSGFLLPLDTHSTTRQAIIKKAKGIMWPYLTFGLAKMLFDFVLSLISSSYSFSLKTEVAEILCWENNSNWFLPPLFFASDAYILLHKKNRQLSFSLFICAASYLLLTAARALLNLSWLISDVLSSIINHYVIRHNVYLLGRTAAFLIYIELGAFVCRFPIYLNSVLRLTKKVFVFIGACLIFGGTFIVANLNGLNDLHMLAWGHTAVYFTLSIIGASSLIIIIGQIKSPLPVLNQIGKDTLIINGTHLAFSIVLLAPALISKVLPPIGNSTINALLRTILTFIIEYLIIVPLYKTILSPLVKYDRFASLISFVRKKEAK